MIFFALCKNLYFFEQCPRGKSQGIFSVKWIKSLTKQKKNLKMNFMRRKMMLDLNYALSLAIDYLSFAKATEGQIVP